MHSVPWTPECQCLLKESIALSFVDTFYFPLLLSYRDHTNFLFIKMGDLPNMGFEGQACAYHSASDIKLEMTEMLQCPATCLLRSQG